MKAVALLIVAVLHEPVPEDFVRFKLPLVPSQCNAIRAEWQYACSWRDAVIEAHRCNWPSDPPKWDGLLMDAKWRVAVWYNAWSMCDLCTNGIGPYPEYRVYEWRAVAAQELRRLLGPVDYYWGRLPPP